MHPATRSTLAAILLVCSIGIFYLATIREGHVLGDDHAAYVGHARNIAEGRNYGEIGYVRSPSGINPQMYPPGYPLLLAPVYHFYGLDPTPMKVMDISFFCTALFLLYFLVRNYGHRAALATVAIIGACPYFWDFKDTIASEHPFLAFAFGALLAGRCADGNDETHRSQILLGLAAGVLCGLAYATRGVGLVLPPAVCLSNFVATRKITRFSIATVIGFAGIATGQRLLFELHSDYLTPLLHVLSVRSLLGSPWYYFKCLAVPWDNGYSSAGQTVLYTVLVGLALRGVWICCRRRWTGVEFFSLFYLAFIVLFPWGGRRYLIPIMPMFVLYALVGLRKLAAHWHPANPPGFRSKALPGREIRPQEADPIPPAGRPPALSRSLTVVIKNAFTLPRAIALTILVTFVLKYTSLPWQAIPGGIRTPGFTEIAEYLQQNADASGPVVFFKARLLALYAEIPVADGFTADSPDEVLAYYHRISASRFIVQQSCDEPGNTLLRNFVITHPGHFMPEKQLGAFHVFRFID